MSEAKKVLPAYIKTGTCSECGAAVYAPERQSAGERLPSMSACACVEGPKIVNLPDANKSRRVNEKNQTGKAQGAGREERA
ncbi:MAG TPA: hypothetical protein VF666_18705 [Pyrinomonadaceae bacterium]